MKQDRLCFGDCEGPQCSDGKHVGPARIPCPGAVLGRRRAEVVRQRGRR